MSWIDGWLAYGKLRKEFDQYKENANVMWDELVECRKRNPKPHPQPSVTVVITGQELTSMGIPQTHRADSTYKLVHKDDFDEWIASDPTSERNYISEFYDCDDFAHDLVTYAHEWVPGLCIGEVWIKSRPHAINIFVDIDKKIWMYEPQNDDFWECDLNDIYFMRL